MSDREESRDELARELEDARKKIDALEKDVGEWRRKAEQLRASRESFRQIFEHSNDAILVIDMDRERILDANSRTCEMLGYTKEDLRELPVSDLHPDDMARLRLFAGAVARQGAGWTDELTYRTRLGRRIATEASASLTRMGDATCLITMVRDISVRKDAEERLRAAYERMKTDLDAAVRLQKSLLPGVSPVVAGLRFAWEVHPCEDLAGDILNVFRLDDNHVAFYVLDVSGHGAAAAMMSMTLHRALSPPPSPTSVLVRVGDGDDGAQIRSPGEVCDDLNVLFPMELDTPQYFTLLYGVLDSRSRELRYASAGHCPPVYLSPSAPPVEMDGSGPPVGLVATARYREHRLRLAPRSRLYVYSDGLTDATNSDGEPFGRERLLAAIEECRDQALRDSLAALLGHMRDWSRNSRLHDDVSLLALETGDGRG